MHGPDKEFYDELISTLASGVVGRGMYDAASAWDGTNPFEGENVGQAQHLHGADDGEVAEGRNWLGPAADAHAEAPSAHSAANQGGWRPFR